jgi:hypothetical protein
MSECPLAPTPAEAARALAVSLLAIALDDARHITPRLAPEQWYQLQAIIQRVAEGAVRPERGTWLTEALAVEAVIAAEAAREIVEKFELRWGAIAVPPMRADVVKELTAALETLLARATRAERERCAKIAEEWPEVRHEQASFLPRVFCTEPVKIAAAIRALRRGPEGTGT